MSYTGTKVQNLAKIRQSLVENLNYITKENPRKVDGNCESDKNGETGWEIWESAMLKLDDKRGPMRKAILGKMAYLAKVARTWL